MSRYWDDDYEEDFPNQLAFWQANADRALKGKRGRLALRDLREALLALPEPRLIEGALCTVNPQRRIEELPRYGGGPDLAAKVERNGEGVCAIGALLWYRKVKAGMDPAEAFDSLPTLDDSNHDLDDTARLAVGDAGIVYSVAWRLACRNDETFRHMNPQERHAAFLAWIDAELADETASPS
jgi:hypothetical protein